MLGILLVPMLVSAQNWTQDDSFVATGTDIWLEVHGVAVDADGKVWIQPFSATETIITNRDVGADGIPDTLSTRAIYVYNADGTQASFSPIIVAEWADGTTPNDTLGRFWDPTLNDGAGGYDTRSGRGITADADGNIIASQWNTLFKFNPEGKVLAKTVPTGGASGCSLTEATADASNNVYVGCVVADGTPIMKFDSNLENEEAVVNITGTNFSRDFQVSGDGNTIWWAGYTNAAIYRYTKPDPFSGFGAADTVLRGIKAEVFDIHPITKYLWVGAGSLNDVPDAPWTPQTWYAFDYADLESAEPLDSMRWVPGGDGEFDAGRPRGLDFSADGKTAYVSVFSGTETDHDVQKFTTTQVFVSNEDENLFDTPSAYSLDQNYPNPFNPTTNISFTLKDAGFVSLKVYDLTGRLVGQLANERMNAGEHTRTFNAQGLASGVYIYTLEANGVRLTNKMTLIK